MSVLRGISKADFKTGADGLLELNEEWLQKVMRTEPITDVYHVEQTPFARGKFASVRKIRHLETKVEYAGKFIRKRRRAADTTREILHEVAVLALCADSERVVRLHEVYSTRTEIVIVLELCVGGELQRLLDEEERLAERAARRALRHALEGLRHLHARRVAHLDLKPQNLLLSANGEDLLICDFGISRAIRPGATVREILGTRDYVAPEILSYEPLTLAADIWSVGVLAYVLLSGYSPFAGDTKQETYLNIAQCQLTFPEDLFHGVSGRAVQFIRDTLVVDPNGRLTVEECLEHPWLKDDAGIPSAIVGVGADLSDHESEDVVVNGTNGVSGTNGTNGVNGINGTNGMNGKDVNGVNGTHENGTNGVNGTHENCTNGVIGTHENGTNGVNGTHENGTNGVNGTHENGTNGVNGTHENGTKCVNGVNGHSDCNGDAQDDSKECGWCGGERGAALKHGRGVSPPFPDAPSTPKVSRKSHPPSVLALCKKFQPDYEKPAKLATAECGACGPALRPRADRAVLC